MIEANIKHKFNASIVTIWNIVTNNKDYSWRSDLSKITINSDNDFTEHSKDGFKTDFKIKNKENLKIYELEFENPNLKGYWIGRFTKLEDETVEIDFTEKVEVNNILMKLFAKKYLKTQQKTYITDLENKLQIMRCKDEK